MNLASKRAGRGLVWMSLLLMLLEHLLCHAVASCSQMFCTKWG